MVLSLPHQSCLILALFLSPQNLMVLSSFTSEPHGPLSIYLLQNLVVLPFTSEPRGLLFTSELHGLLLPSELHGLHLPPPKPCGPPPSMAAAPRFKSQHPSSFAAPFPTPPTVSYTCQHPRILPALLGCHSKSGQVWPHGVSQSSPSSHAGPVTRGSCFPVPSWVEVTPIPLAQSRATAI